MWIQGVMILSWEKESCLLGMFHPRAFADAIAFVWNTLFLQASLWLPSSLYLDFHSPCLWDLPLPFLKHNFFLLIIVPICLSALIFFLHSTYCCLTYYLFYYFFSLSPKQNSLFQGQGILEGALAGSFIFTPLGFGSGSFSCPSGSSWLASAFFFSYIQNQPDGTPHVHQLASTSWDVWVPGPQDPSSELLLAIAPLWYLRVLLWPFSYLVNNLITS